MSVLEQLMPSQQDAMRVARGRRLVMVDAPQSADDVRHGMSLEERIRFDRMLAACDGADATIDVVTHCALAARRRPS